MGGNLDAVDWLEKGQLATAAGTEAALREALHCFAEGHRAAEALDGLAPEVRRLRALLSMNEGSVLRALGKWSEALEAYDAAGTQLLPIPDSADAAWRNSLGATLLNRGELLLLLGRPESIEAMKEAVGWLEPALTEEWTATRRNLVGAWTNLSQAEFVFSTRPGPEALKEADRNVERALDLALPFSATNADALQMTLLALRQSCDIIGQALPQLDPEAAEAWAEKAVLLMEHGFDLAKGAGELNGASIRLVQRLFFFGGQLNAVHRPHELISFLDAHRPPATADQAPWKAAAQAALTKLSEDLTKPRYWSVDDPRSMELVAVARRARAWASAEGFRFETTA